MERCKLGRSGIEISAMGLGCWAMGGPAWRDDEPIGWGQVDDDESVRAIYKGLEMGVNFLDTADVYGCGHSEHVIGKALAGRRDEVVIATKFGFGIDEKTLQASAPREEPEYIRSACDASLKRLNTDYIDLYQFHVGQSDNGPAVRDVLEELVSAGKIRYYGWSTDDPQRAKIFAEGEHCCAIQLHLNVFEGSLTALAACDQYDLAAIIRGPLNRGVLTGKFGADSKFTNDDVRREWSFKEGRMADRLKVLEAIRQILTSGGRTLTQGALCWLWGKSKMAIPIPGFKTAAQVEENAAALAFDALSAEQVKQIDELVAPYWEDW